MIAPKVSVIMPTYNHGKYILESIQSILEQTLQDFEIIIVNNASTDNTLKILQQISDPRIKVFSLAVNRGSSIAHNYGIKQAKGTYIAILHSDDKAHPEKLAKQVKYLDTHPECSACFTYIKTINETSKESHLAMEQSFIQINRNRYEWLNYCFVSGNHFAQPTVMLRKAVHETVGWYDERLVQLPDFEMWIRLLQKFEVYILPEALTYYRVRNKNANASAFRPDTLARAANEYHIVLEHFLHLASDDFFKVFPDLKAENIVPNEQEFLFAKLCLAQKARPYVQDFGMKCLYKLCKDDSFKKYIIDKYQFDYPEFTQITGSQIYETKVFKVALKNFINLILKKFKIKK